MNISVYQGEAARTLIDSPGKSFTDQELMTFWVSAGIAGESGELAGAVIDGSYSKISIEVGDLCWYISSLCTIYKLNFEGFDVPVIPVTSASGEELALKVAYRAGLLNDYLKKCIFHSHDLSIDTLCGLIYDLMIAIRIFCNAVGVDFHSSLDLNIAKLKTRYPNGFDRDRSRNRAESQS